MDTQVLIVGGGPTGLMLANQLARRGIRTIIIDRHSGPAQQTRAMAVHARTLEIYQQLGISERAVSLGARGNGANMWVNGQRKARIPLAEMGENQSPFPYVLMLGQDENERILGERLRDFGQAVQWNTELIGLQQERDHVVATLQQPDGSTRMLKAAYVAGCDGGRSTVREISGIKFPGAPYEHVFFVADTTATGPMVPSELNVYLWKDGFHLFFPMPGTNRWRVIGILPKHLRSRNDLTFEEVVPSLTEEAGTNLSFQSCDWFSTYRIHHRCVEHFRDRRVFLAGDAAHVHSPMGGQGMNTGLQDAYNLAWKLALVVQGQADEKLLDSYEAERLPVARALLDSTDRMFTTVVSEGWIARLLRTRVIFRVASFAMSRPKLRARAFRTLSQIGICYPESPLSQSNRGLPEHAPRAGDRFPWMQLRFAANGPAEDLFRKLDDRRFNLVVVGQPAPAFDGLNVLSIAADGANASELARARVPSKSFFLLRPDGHVGLAGLDLDPAAVTRYLATIGVRLPTKAGAADRQGASSVHAAVMASTASRPPATWSAS